MCGEISEFIPQEGSISECDASDSEPNSDETDNDDEDEESESLVDEDDNAPIRPGEDIPPLETKYLPIFEALHERGKVLTKPEKTYLVNMTGMTYRQITIWFQNRRRGELKEHAQHICLSRAGSIDSSISSHASGDNDLEQRIALPRSGATFDIRTWRLTSALPIKAVNHGTFPISPTKVNFGGSMVNSDSDSSDTDSLNDSDEETDIPPGLPAPSLSASITAANSAASVHIPEDGLGTATEPVVYNDMVHTGAKSTLRVTKSLPVRQNKPSPTQATPIEPSFAFNFGHASLASIQSQTTSAPVSPPHSVTSNARGLTIQMNNVHPSSATTLQLPSQVVSGTSMLVSTPISSNGPSSQHSVSTESPQRSPTPSNHSASSPRPPVKPLPRRTGCAPRPRPPPRINPPPVKTSGTAPSSQRPSIVLPPSSNPSLGNTTLGSLLRPNQATPRISQEMEERLTAMAGRMGVGVRANAKLSYPSTSEATPITSMPNTTH
ncbi:hypothetical protein BN14_02264 [Rhizoctonia solani AG-1 IB]|nr:hypothetical protein BN14_02264 [Rhizoctonia solani AG-1 IB]